MDQTSGIESGWQSRLHSCISAVACWQVVAALQQALQEAHKREESLHETGGIDFDSFLMMLRADSRDSLDQVRRVRRPTPSPCLVYPGKHCRTVPIPALSSFSRCIHRCNSASSAMASDALLAFCCSTTTGWVPLQTGSTCSWTALAERARPTGASPALQPSQRCSEGAKNWWQRLGQSAVTGANQFLLFNSIENEVANIGSSSGIQFVWFGIWFYTLAIGLSGADEHPPLISVAA